MKTELKTLDKCQAQLTVKLDAEEMKAIVKDVEKVFVREAHIPGFRPGKAPIDLVRKNFSAQIKEETTRTMFQKNYAAAVKEAGVQEVALADVKDVEFTTEGGSFVAVIDVKPKFKLPTYKGLKIAPAKVDVDDAAVADHLKRLSAGFAKYEDASSEDGSVAAEGDFIQIDYSGTVGKKTVLEIAPDAKVIAEGKGFWTSLEEGRFIPEILDAVKGMKIGEEKTDITVKFDKENAPEGLKGEKAAYTVKLAAIRHRILPSDAELVEKMKAESFEALTKTVREQLEKSAEKSEKARRENDVIEALLKKADFDVPQSQVQRAMEGYLNDFAQRAQYSGLGADYFEKNREQILKDATEIATRQVRLWYIIDAIAAEEKIEAKDEAKGLAVVDLILSNAKA